MRSRTRGGSRELAVGVGRLARLPADQIRQVYWGALVHDIGELDVPEAIFEVPGPLGVNQRASLAEHTVVGARWLATHSRPRLARTVRALASRALRRQRLSRPPRWPRGAAHDRVGRRVRLLGRDHRAAAVPLGVLVRGRDGPRWRTAPAGNGAGRSSTGCSRQVSERQGQARGRARSPARTIMTPRPTSRSRTRGSGAHFRQQYASALAMIFPTASCSVRNASCPDSESTTCTPELFGISSASSSCSRNG